MGAANVPLNTSDRRVMTRWVAARSGTVEAILIRVKIEGAAGCDSGGRPGYAAGDAGVLRATTHPVDRSGRPVGDVVLARSAMAPCTAARGESITLPLNIRVERGRGFATVVWNSHPDPAGNHFSTNHLFVASAAAGAHAFDVRPSPLPRVPAPWPGLDTSEAVGLSEDGGRTWQVPARPYGEGDPRTAVPTYILRYRDGQTTGQPFYYGLLSREVVEVAFPPVRYPRTISQIRAHAIQPGAATAEVLVDGTRRAGVRLEGPGVAQAPLAPVAVPAGAHVTVRVPTGTAGLGLPALFSDRVWADAWHPAASSVSLLPGHREGGVPVALTFERTGTDSVTSAD